MTNEEYSLSDRIELKPSSYGGIGVLVRQSIKKGEVVLYYVGTCAHFQHVKTQDRANDYTTQSINPGFEHPNERSGMATDGRSYACYHTNVTDPSSHPSMCGLLVL